MISVIEAIPAARRRASGQIRVASVPAGHVYVRHLSDPDGGDAVVRLPDIPPADGRRVPGGWWPPAMLDADWIAAHHDTFDVFHVHFGFDAKTPEELRAVAGALRARGRPARGHRPRPAQPASPHARAARRAARGADRARRRRDHAHAGRGAGDRGALGPGRDRPAAPARRGLGHDGSPAPRPRRVRRRAARQERAGQHGRARPSPPCWRTRWPRCRARGCRSTSTTRCSSRARTTTTRRRARRCGSSRASDVEVREHDVLQRRRAVGVPEQPRRLGAAVPLRHALRAGWRRAWTWAPPSSRRAAGSTPSSSRCSSTATTRPGSTPARSRRRSGAAYDARPGASRASVVERREQRRALSAAHEALYARVLRVRIGIVAAARFPIAEPFAGGLEAHVWGAGRTAAPARARGDAVRRAGIGPAARRRVPRSAPPAG